MQRRDALARDISALMPRIARWILLDFFQSVDIPQAQLFTIMTLDEHPECRFTDLREALHVSAPTVTGIIDRLESNGFVHRQPDPRDRRAITIKLTKKGKNIVTRLRGVIRSRWAEILEHLSRDDQEQFVRILKEVQRQLLSKSNG